MSDENTNQQGTKSDGTSEDDILESSAYDEKEKLIPIEGAEDAIDKSSAVDSTPGDTNFEKMDNKGTYLEVPETNKAAIENLKKNSNSPTQKKKRSLIPYMLVMLALIAIILSVLRQFLMVLGLEKT